MLTARGEIKGFHLIYEIDTKYWNVSEQVFLNFSFSFDGKITTFLTTNQILSIRITSRYQEAILSCNTSNTKLNYKLCFLFYTHILKIKSKKLCSAEDVDIIIIYLFATFLGCGDRGMSTFIQQRRQHDIQTFQKL